MYSILYVDDEPTNLSTFKAVFRRYFAVFTALSGMDALKVLSAENIDLIITDQRMPEMTGVELLEKVQITHPEIVRMVLTGYSDLQAVIDAINRGRVYHFISKPWQVEEFKSIIDNALDMYSLKRKHVALEMERQTLLLQTEKQEKQNLLAQFELLKNQMNPHFLFNSLHTLRSIIQSDPEKADKFTSHFAKLYRSLLEAHDQFIIPFQEEIEFVKSFVFLQQIRFDESLSVLFDECLNDIEDCIPPFALQTLIENAIKHNIVSRSEPLEIKISCDENYLIVENNLQKRNDVQDSLGIGLNNIRERYKLITPQPMVVEESNEIYLVKLPLIPEAH